MQRNGATERRRIESEREKGEREREREREMGTLYLQYVMKLKFNSYSWTCKKSLA